MAQELEIKLTLNKGMMAGALAWLNARPEATLGERTLLVNTYYDTPQADLQRLKAALRVRDQEGTYIQTLKTQGRFVNGVHQRDEWEWPLSGAELNPDLLADTTLGKCVDALGKGLDLAQLVPIFETKFHRKTVMIDDGEAVIECASDLGVVDLGAQPKQLCEVEFELKSGNPQRLLVWAERLAQQCPVFVNLVSKAEQGYYLAGLYTPEPDSQQPDVVIALLQRLAIAWLTGAAVDLEGLDQAELAARAQSKAVTDQLRALMDQLQAGVGPAELLKQPDLGQLQLALLM